MSDNEPLTDGEMERMEADVAQPWEYLCLVRRSDFKRLMSELRMLRAVAKATQSEREELARLRELAVWAKGRGCLCVHPDAKECVARAHPEWKTDRCGCSCHIETRSGL